jgi:hypothetical protein
LAAEAESVFGGAALSCKDTERNLQEPGFLCQLRGSSWRSLRLKAFAVSF